MQVGLGKSEKSDCKMKLTLCDVESRDKLNIGHYVQVYSKKYSGIESTFINSRLKTKVNLSKSRCSIWKK